MFRRFFNKKIAQFSSSATRRTRTILTKRRISQWYRIHPFLYHKGAQSSIEYAVLISLVAAAIIGMHLYVRRAACANLKTVERELNLEWER